MTKPLHEENPPAGPLITDEVVGRGLKYLARRPRGRSDWLMLYTLEGLGRFTREGQNYPLNPGDLVLVRPRAPQDYGTEETLQRWHNIWCHFIPRGEMLVWLDWPELVDGVMHLRLPADLQPIVLAQLRELITYRQQHIGHSEQLALNALERALLLADSANPRSTTARYDPRIRKSIEHILAHLTEPMSLESIAAQCDLSRSRFALLFESQVGLPPGQFIEQHRLARVKRLLESTQYTLDDIASECGFSSPFYLSLRFKKLFGLSPKAYRESVG